MIYNPQETVSLEKFDQPLTRPCSTPSTKCYWNWLV